MEHKYAYFMFGQIFILCNNFHRKGMMKKLKFRLLFGDNIEGSGKRLAKIFSHFGFETEYCANLTKTLREQLKNKSYDGILFFALRASDNIYRFISDCRNAYPDIKIYPIISTDSNTVKQKLIDSGATSCLLMPYTEYSLCYEVINDFFSSDELIILPEIAEFLYTKGFPNQLIGFYVLCCAIEIVINAPHTLSKVTSLLYPSVAEIMNTTYDSVERSLRVLSSAAFKNGVNLNGEITKKRPKTKTLIALLADEYAKIYGL